MKNGSGILSLAGRSALAAIVLYLGCSLPPPTETTDVASPIHALFPATEPQRFVAYGEATISVGGDAHTCGIAVRAVADSFRASFYGPLGFTIGSIGASMTSGEGVLNFRGEEQPFDLSQTVAVPSFGLRQTLTYRDLIRILLGRVPAVFEEPLEKPADSIFKQNGAITSLWKTDSMEFHVRMEHHPAEVVELVSINKGNDGEELTMSAFKYGRASRIAVQESDGNYFSVTYSRVKPH